MPPSTPIRLPIAMASHAPGAVRIMKGSITRKLFLAILAANVLVAIAVGVAMRLSFSAGFVDYVSEREARRLRDLSDVLATACRENGSWNFLRGNDTLWQQLNAPHFPGTRPPPRRPDGDPRRAANDADTGRPHRDADGRRPPRDLGSRDGPPPRHEGFPRAGGPTTGLLDDAKQPVIGITASTSDSVLQPIVVDGTTVGWLTGNFLAGPLRDLDRRFQEKQKSATWAIGGIALLLSAIVALLLARGLLAPVRELAAATHRLAAGDFATRVRAFGRDELGQLSEDFNRLALALERTERMRRDFMADVSHELRTPLAVLRGELEALQDGIRTLTPHSLASLQAEVDTLSKLIDNLYDLSLADVGALAYRKEPLAIVPAVERALGVFRERLAARRIAVETRFPDGEPLVIDGDPARLTQLFNNLLENTIRYTDPDGVLRIAVAREGDRVRLDFQDSAPGVAEALLPRLFERLFRVESSRNRASGGAGLGLSLCRNIVEAHGVEKSTPGRRRWAGFPSRSGSR